MGKKETLGLGGDQDYDSMIGWEPERIKRKKGSVSNEAPGMLWCRTMNRWMGTVREGLSEDALFGPFWRKYELAIMFSSAGVGKSLLATQIAEHLARGFRMEPFLCTPPISAPCRVLYLDFELTREQLISRYSVADGDGIAGKDVYSFSSGIIRTESWWNGRLGGGFESFADLLFDEILKAVHEFQIDTLIVDNVTFLDRSSTSNTDVSLGIMRRLNDLKKSEAISILVLAHTSKPSSQPGPITEADLQGSVNLCNFADAVFALGRSVFSQEVRYLKQIKSRSGRIEYDATNVPLFTLGKFDLARAMGLTARPRPPVDNFLGYRFTAFGDENELCGRVRFSAESRRNELRLKARSLARRGRQVASIAAELGVSRTTAHRYVKGGKV